MNYSTVEYIKGGVLCKVPHELEHGDIGVCTPGYLLNAQDCWPWLFHISTLNESQALRLEQFRFLFHIREDNKKKMDISGVGDRTNTASVETVLS
jgi:hypothetical protein